MTNNVMWITGRFVGKNWQILGLYSNKESAIKRCRCSKDFIGPVEIDIDLPDEEISWPGCFYPIAMENTE
jgi:hypothetical protein